jgi:hypothetical protein
MQNYQTNIEDLGKCTVAIQKAGDNGRILGTGVIVTDDGLILTCYHVIGEIKNKTIKHNSIDVYFPEFKITKSASAVKEYCDPSIDVAFFKIENGSLSNKTTVSNLGEGIIFGHKFASIGFRKPKVFEKLSSSGEIRIKTSFKTKEDNIESPQLIQLYSDEIEPGMSGSPILDLETNKVVGIISEHWVSASNNVDARLNFGIPIESILKVPAIESILRERNPGLKKIHQFMEKIGLGKSKIYQRFDDVYVAPTEYNEIEGTLRENNCVFITGTAEYGKTFTAIKLLWEYSKKDIPITPKYIPEEAKEESKDIIKKLKNQDEDLQNTVIYLEDPIGKYKYESNPEFESSFVDIFESLHDLNTYLIITSREEIYQQFHPIGGLDTITKNVVKKLNIGKRSYDYEKREEMLLRWAAIYRCRWLEDDKLKNMIFEIIKNNDAKLSTPLNIKDFAYATRYENSNAIVLDSKKEEELIKTLDKKSERTPEVFAEEITEMEPEKILFLCFLFVSGRFPIEFVKEKYKELVNELANEFKIGEGEDALKFERVLDSFKDSSKVDTNYDAFLNKYTLRFSHPSYYEAILLMISKNGAFKLPRKILSVVLLKLFSTYSEVALIVASNFDNLPENVQNLLSKIPDNKQTAGMVAFAIAANFDKLPENVQNLLFKLADNKETAVGVAYALTEKFDELPGNVRNELLVKLSDNKETAVGVAYVISHKFDKLPENVQNLLFKLADNQETAGMAALVIGVNFDRLPDTVRNLLFKLADNKDTAKDVAYTIADNYGKLPDTVRNLLFKLAEHKEIAASVAFAISFCCDRLPDNVLELLFKLVENKETASDVANVVIWNYKLPDTVRKILLFKLANNNKEIAASVADVVAYNFDRLPDNVRNELFKLADNKEASGNISYAVAKYFDKLPDNVRNELLLKPADNKETARYIAWFTAYNFNNLPYNVRNHLFMFADEKETAAIVADAIAWQFDKLPENVQNLLFKLAENKETASSVSYAVSKHFDRLADSVRNELLKKLENIRENANDIKTYG